MFILFREVPITKLETVGRTVHVLAAKALIRDLEQSRSHLHYRWTSVPVNNVHFGSCPEIQI
jgi:Fe2+ or Zn2+ uptake regulation protein